MYVESLSQTKFFCFALLNIICIFCNWLNLVRQIDWHDGYYRLPRNDALGLWKGNITICHGSLLSSDQESRSLTLHFSSGWRPTPSCCLMWSQWSSANSLSAIWTTLARLWWGPSSSSWSSHPPCRAWPQRWRRPYWSASRSAPWPSTSRRRCPGTSWSQSSTWTAPWWPRWRWSWSVSRSRTTWYNRAVMRTGKHLWVFFLLVCL